MKKITVLFCLLTTSWTAMSMASTTTCDLTGKYIEAYGTKYDSSITDEVEKYLFCENNDGSRDGFFLTLKGCSIKNVNVIMTNDSASEPRILAEVSGQDLKNRTLKYNGKSGTDLISIEGNSHLLSISIKSEQTDKAYLCRLIEGP